MRIVASLVLLNVIKACHQDLQLSRLWQEVALAKADAEPRLRFSKMKLGVINNASILCRLLEELNG